MTIAFCSTDKTEPPTYTCMQCGAVPWISVQCSAPAPEQVLCKAVRCSGVYFGADWEQVLCRAVRCSGAALYSYSRWMSYTHDNLTNCSLLSQTSVNVRLNFTSSFYVLCFQNYKRIFFLEQRSLISLPFIFILCLCKCFILF